MGLVDSVEPATFPMPTEAELRANPRALGAGPLDRFRRWLDGAASARQDDTTGVTPRTEAQEPAPDRAEATGPHFLEPLPEWAAAPDDESAALTETRPAESRPAEVANTVAEAPALPAPPARLTGGILGAGDVVHRLGAGPQDFTLRMADALAEPLGTDNADLARDQIAEHLQTEHLGSWLFGLSNGETRNLTIDTPGWQGRIPLRATLRNARTTGTVAKFEFEPGVESGTGTAVGYDANRGWNAGVAARGTFPFVRLDLGATYARESGQGTIYQDMSRMTARGKTVSKALAVTVDVRFELDLSHLVRGDGTAPPEPLTRKTVTLPATLSTPYADSPSVPPAGTARSVPSYMSRMRAPGPFDLLVDSYPVNADGARRDGGLNAILRQPLPRVSDRSPRDAAVEVFGSARDADEVLAALEQLVPFTALHQQLRTLMWAGPLIVDLPDGLGRVELEAELGAARFAHHTENGTEFNVGTSTGQSVLTSSAHSRSTNLAGTLQGNQLGDTTSWILPGMAEPSGLKALVGANRTAAKEANTLQEESATTGATVKAKVPSSVFDTTVVLTARFRNADGRTAEGRAPMGARFIVRTSDTDEAADGSGTWASSWIERGTAPAEPRSFVLPVFRAGDVVHRPELELSDDSVVLALLAGGGVAIPELTPVPVSSAPQTRVRAPGATSYGPGCRLWARWWTRAGAGTRPRSRTPSARSGWRRTSP